MINNLNIGSFLECMLFKRMRTPTPERDLVGCHVFFFKYFFLNVCVSLVSDRGIPKLLPQQTIIDFFFIFMLKVNID